MAIVSERLAARLWPSDSAIGKRIALNVDPSSAPAYREVVGVVASVRRDQLGGPGSLDVYIPYRQTSEPNHYVLARTALSPREFQARAEQALWSIDREQSLFDFRTYPDRILDGVWQLRLSRLLLAIFGGVALALAGVGIYGLMSYLVAMQYRELGVRLALGAAPRSIRGLIVRRGLALAVTGGIAGIFGAAALGSALRTMLPALPSFDFVSFGAAAAVTVAAALCASAIPAWHASRIDPAIALRGE